MAPASPVTEPEDLRQRILRASVELLTEEGVGGLSLREVARRAGVSHQAPYHHFADREAILAAIAEEGFHKLHDRFAAAMHDLETAPLEALDGGFAAYVGFACENPAHFRVMFRPELVPVHRHPSCAEAGERAYSYLTRAVEVLIRKGHYRGAPEPLIALIWSTSHGLASLILDGPLANKMPGAADRDTIVADVARTFRSLIERSAG